MLCGCAVSFAWTEIVGANSVDVCNKNMQRNITASLTVFRPECIERNRAVCACICNNYIYMRV